MRHGRRDANHAEIKAALISVCGPRNVLDTADMGQGFPDLVVGFKGRTYLLEIKSSRKAKLRPAQADLMAGWRGGPFVRVDTAADALREIGCSV